MPRWLFALLLALPVALLAEALHAPPLVVFLAAALSLIPLAGLIGVATEALAERVGQTLGGLLNATFGNAAELIIGITALGAGLTNVVLASITGSIIGNVLLVLGMSMVLGGWRHGVQRFNKAHAGHYAVMMAVAVVGMALPSLMALPGEGTPPDQHAVRGLALHQLSLAVALLLLVSYIAYVAFSVFRVRAGSHGRDTESLANEPHTPLSEPAYAEQRATRDHSSHAEKPEAMRAAHRGTSLTARLAGLWHRSPWAPVAALAVATAGTAVASEVLVGAIEPVAKQIGLNPFFIGLIILPLVGNAAEHFSAVTFAMRDQMDVSMAITAGSSIQVALLVAPVLVFVSWFIGTPLDLRFAPLELVILALVTALYGLVSLDGESTWLEGLQLGVFYLIVAFSLFFITA